MFYRRAEPTLGLNVSMGAGHSAANILINLATLIQTAPETRVTWVIRNRSVARVFTSDDDELASRAGLGTKVQKLLEFGVIEVVDGFEIIELVLPATGVCSTDVGGSSCCS